MRSTASTRILRLFLVLFLLPVFAGCTVITSTNQDRPEIYAFIHSTDNEFWQQAAWGLEAAAKDRQASLEVQEINLTDDYDNSLDLIKKAVRRSTKAIIITPFASEKLHKLLEKAQKYDIALIYLDAPEPYDIPGTYIYSDNEKASEKAGQLLADSLGGKGKVVMLNIAAEHPKAAEREKGFRKAIREYPEIKLVNIFDCNGDRNTTAKTIADILAAHPDIQGIYAACPETSAGTVQALTALDRVRDIKVVGFDHTVETMNFASAGVIHAYVGQDSYELGYKAVEAVLDILSGKSVPEMVDVGYIVSEIHDSADHSIEPGTLPDNGSDQGNESGEAREEVPEG